MASFTFEMEFAIPFRNLKCRDALGVQNAKAQNEAAIAPWQRLYEMWIHCTTVTLGTNTSIFQVVWQP
jgi:hypothetical protein